MHNKYAELYADLYRNDKNTWWLYMIIIIKCKYFNTFKIFPCVGQTFSGLWKQYIFFYPGMYALDHLTA